MKPKRKGKPKCYCGTDLRDDGACVFRCDPKFRKTGMYIRSKQTVYPKRVVKPKPDR